MRNLSGKQRSALLILLDGENPYDYCRGRSQFGGMSCTLLSLIKRGYVIRDDYDGHALSNSGVMLAKDILSTSGLPNRKK